MHFGMNLCRLEKAFDMLEKERRHYARAALIKEAIKLGRKFVDFWTVEIFHGYYYSESDKYGRTE